MKAKPCPWCGWNNTHMITFAKGNFNRYMVDCLHCGLRNKKPSIFKWLAIWRWNHMERPGARNRYHIYGREF